jgi:hypothetical protein
MPEQDNDAPELREAEVIVHPPLVAHHQPPGVREPSEQPLDLPAPLVAPELATVLGFPLLPVPTVRRYHHYAPFFESPIQRVRIVGPVFDRPLGFLSGAARRERRSTRVTSCGEALAAFTARGRPEASAGAMSFVPLPRLVFPTDPPPFWRPRTCRR